LRELIRVSLDGRYEFTEASDGSSCLAAAREARPDVIVLDIMLPGRNGIDVLRDLRADPSLADMPVIVLTAQPATREEALREGASRVMAVEEVLAGPR